MSIERCASVRDQLIEALEADLIGPVFDDVPEEVLRFAPSRFYLTGFLAPLASREVLPTDDDEELDDASAKDEDDAGQKETEPKEKRLFPASIGMSMLLPIDAKEVTAIVGWADYRREEQAVESEASEGTRKKGRKKRPKVLWKRTPYGPVDVLVRLDAEALRRGVEVPGSRGLRVSGELRGTHDMPGLPSGTRALSLFLVNARPAAEDKEHDEEQFAFQVSLAVECAAGFVARANIVGQRSKDPDERTADLQYRARREYAVGHGVAVEAAEGDKVRVVRSTHLPRVMVRRVEPRQLDGVTVSMDQLGAVTDAASLRAALGGIAAAYGDWIAREKARVATLDGKERKGTATELIGNARRAQSRIEAGLKILESDPYALDAFKNMNVAMAEAARRRDGTPDARPSWRLFQLAFVLLNLRGIVEPGDDDRRTVELIFFPTGGGKTEAYLGVIAFLLLYRRLSRRKLPDQGLGVAVILRYTLRLLTLDQLGRAATLICALEQMRKAEPERLGDVRFSLGLWVGKSATANTLAEAAELIAEYKNSESANAASPFPLTSCPWCRSPIEKDAFTVVGAKSNPSDIRVACTHSACEFSIANEADGLPVLFADEQIYHELPSFLIATVDKFAMMPWRGETAGFFGRVQARDQRRYFGAADGATSKSAAPLPDGLLPPDLIVQDELHLISGPLGTMVGLYETAIEGLAARTRGGVEILPKIIASTATVRRAQAQIQALYGRTDLALFPPPGIDENESFFACVDERNEGRTYVGVAAPGRAMKGMLLRTYVALLGAAEKCAAESVAAADPYLTLVGYFNSLRELGGMRRLVEDEVRTRASSIEDRRPEGTTEHRWVKNRSVGFEPVELTSRRTTAEIAADKARLEKSAVSGERVDICLASNMISVGIDIARLGLMVMAGQPKTTSEYIQASSRVGRKVDWPGLVVTVLNVNKARDRSHFERFVAYHESFYREVEATSVTPFADPALQRGMAGTLVAMTRLGDSEMTPSGAVSKFPKRRQAGEAAVAKLAARAASQPGLGGDADKAKEVVMAAGRSLLDAWESLAGKDEPRRYSHLEKGGAKGKSLLFTVLDAEGDMRDDDELRFAAPTSMRDVEPSAHLWVRYGVPAKREADSDE